GVAVFILARGEWSATASGIGARWPALLVIIFFQIAGYVFWIASVKTAGAAIPTAAVIAIAASYPALVAVLSGPVLGEHLHWNHALAVVLIVGGVVISQL